MNKSQVFGWCPGAYRPMPVEDGLLARIRPRLSRLSVSQVCGLCELAENYGNGLVEITNRSNVQIRGLTNLTYTQFLNGLREMSLLDKDLETERRRNIIVTPFREPDDENDRIARELIERLSELPVLPTKFGFVIDVATQPYLSTASGDIRIERGIDGLVLRADGAARGMSVTADNVIDELIEMATWFDKHRTLKCRRMKHVVANKPLPRRWMRTTPRRAADLPPEGYHRMGQMVSVPSTPFKASNLKSFIPAYRMSEIRLTPWRMLLIVNEIVRDNHIARNPDLGERAEAQ